MIRFAKHMAVLLAFIMLAGCSSNGENGMKITESHRETEASTETKTVETSVSAETTPAVTTEEITETQTTETVAPPPSTTTVATTAPPVTVTTTTAATTTTTAATAPVTIPPPAAEPVPGVTSKGYTITVKNGVTYVDGVLIANKTYALPETYNPGGLTPETYAAFVEMQKGASAEGLYIYVKSGFRSYYDQRYIYNGYAASDGVELADRYSARAGHSEHQSGMAIDVNSVQQSFANTPEGIWLRDNCHLYGFIIRYPEGKEHITGYMYEPWHVRYVGVDVAKAVKESGLCLEEYFGITSVYGY